ncbi:MAG: hypothetical protein M1817_001691 [Caeruleum heppii]|nr:MAG: hypothetical protein M1817_001691 [Caeruleum heppii]
MVAGIRECEVIQWFVEPEARVEQFDKLCEVQSDKASVEITSRFDGVIKRLHYDAGEMAIVGKPLVDIDIQSEISAEDEALTKPPEDDQSGKTKEPQRTLGDGGKHDQGESLAGISSARSHGTLATPAVRHLVKEMGVDLSVIKGTGRDGRVLKQDVHDHVRTHGEATTTPSGQISSDPTETSVPLTPVQAQMFKTMTRNLSIPHFLYADEVDLTALSSLRTSLQPHLSARSLSDPPVAKLTYLPFILKAVSLALIQHPLLNARIDHPPTDTDPSKKATLIFRSHHHIGVAIDTPQGLLVPCIKNVQSLSVPNIATEIQRLAELGRQGKLSRADLTGTTITVSNIGNVGGTYLAPVIASQNEVCILGIGKAKAVPRFDEKDEVVKRLLGNFSWCADHRVVDGMAMAKMAECVRGFVEKPGLMLGWMR